MKKALKNKVEEKPIIKNNCEHGKLCAPENYFERIEICKLCGKII